MSVGTVKWFNTQRGYGFIAPDGGGKDVFVHMTAIEASGLGRLVEGQRVAFEEQSDPRSGKVSAADLRTA
jgi:CspA family cold shock protein